MKRLLLSCLILTGCGGGGGGDTQVAGVSEVSHYPVESTFTSFFSQARTFNLTARDTSGNAYSAVYQVIPGADKPLNVQGGAITRRTFRLSATVRVNNGAPVTASNEVHYSANPFQIWGVDGAVYTTATTAAPATATVGTTGTLASGPMLAWLGGSSAPHPDPAHVTWALERASAATAWLCIETRRSNPPTGEKDCALIDGSGNVSGFKSTARIGANAVIEFR